VEVRVVSKPSKVQVTVLLAPDEALRSGVRRCLADQRIRYRHFRLLAQPVLVATLPDGRGNLRWFDAVLVEVVLDR
jgi:hypothetical protein